MCWSQENKPFVFARCPNVWPLLMYLHTFGTRFWLPNVHIPAYNFQEVSDFAQIWHNVVSFTLECVVWQPNSPAKSMLIHLKWSYIWASRYNICSGAPHCKAFRGKSYCF
jgi:hypothetical protein